MLEHLGGAVTVGDFGILGLCNDGGTNVASCTNGKARGSPCTLGGSVQLCYKGSAVTSKCEAGTSV